MKRGYLIPVFALALALAMPALAQSYPNSIASLGDSITRAALANDGLGGLDYGQPEHNWSTGYDSGDSCNSHYERIKAANSGITGNYYNVAESGARADDLPGQAVAAVSTGADYVTVLMGGNDLCRDSAAEMTPTATFTSYFTTCLNTLQAGLPDADILVLEVPKIRRVYDGGYTNFGCRYLKWPLFQWCDSALRNGSTERAQVDARNIEYNNALRTLCASMGVFFDDDVYEMSFTYKNLSSVDCFHPNTALNGTLAGLTYDASRF